MYTANEILFPAHVIPELAHMRGDRWRKLVQHILTLPETHEETLALMLMMVRLNGCMECETDSYRAMRGCTACAIQMLRRYKGPDEDLLEQYEAALDDIRSYMARTGQPRLKALLEML